MANGLIIEGAAGDDSIFGSNDNDILVGESIFIHLHNHGPNDWKLGYLKPI